MSELLKVLDITKEEQWVWCAKNIKAVGESLADLAFRLRDEAENKEGLWWSGGLSKVFFYLAHSPERFDLSSEDRMRQFQWFGTKAKPIHWIIAALIAKEMSK